MTTGRRRPTRLGSPAHGGLLVGARPQARRRGIQYGATAQVGLSRGRRTTKVHLGIERNEMVKTVILTPGPGRSTVRSRNHSVEVQPETAKAA